MNRLLFDVMNGPGLVLMLAVILIIVGIVAVIGISSTVVLIILLKKKKRQTEAEEAAKVAETGNEQLVSPVAESVVESPAVISESETGEN